MQVMRNQFSRRQAMVAYRDTNRNTTGCRYLPYNTRDEKEQVNRLIDRLQAQGYRVTTNIFNHC